MDVLFMGTANAAGSVERDNTYMLLQNNEDCWLIDVGGNPLGKLKKAGVPLDRIRGVLFTHFHTDHIYGLPSLLWGMWIAGRTEPLAVYCAQQDEEALRAIMAGYRMQQWPIRFAVDVRPFDWERRSVLIDEPDFTVTTFPSLHAGPTVGFRIVSGGRTLVYSADTRPNELINGMMPIDVLIHEATKARGTMKTHTSMEQLPESYALDQVGAVYAVHLTDGEPYEDVVASFSPAIRDKIKVAHDLMRITV